MCVLTMLKISEINGTEEIGLVTPSPGICGATHYLYTCDWWSFEIDYDGWRMKLVE